MIYVLERGEFVHNARKIMQLAYDNQINAYISASSITDIYYLVQKCKSKEEALSFIEIIISFIEVAGVDKMVILKAINCNFSDFEDAVQNFSAVNSGIEIIVTRNPKDYANFQLKVFEPAQFLEFINK